MRQIDCLILVKALFQIHFYARNTGIIIQKPGPRIRQDLVLAPLTL